MSFANPFATKTNGSTTIEDSELNAAGVSISRAVDGVNGGVNTLATVIDFQGEGARFGGGGAGHWPRVTSRTVTRSHALNVAATSGAANAAVRIQAGGTGALTFSSNGNTITVPHILTTHAAGADAWHLIELLRPISGATLATIRMVTAVSVSDATGYTAAAYDVVRWSYSGSAVLSGATLLAGIAADDHTAPQATAGTRKIQTVTCTTNNVIDTDTYRYGVYVEHPFGDGSGDSVFLIYELEADYTVTDIRPA